jgi:hypothetical protein
MAWDDHEYVLHLTPRGWEPDETPDRVESWRCPRVWANPDVPRTDRDRLREKHKETMGTPDPLNNMVISIGEPL